MTESAYSQELTSQNDAMNQVYKDYILDYHFEKADKKFKYPSVFTQGFLSFAGEENQTGEMAEFEADQKKKAALEKEIAQLKKSLGSIMA